MALTWQQVLASITGTTTPSIKGTPPYAAPGRGPVSAPTTAPAPAVSGSEPSAWAKAAPWIVGGGLAGLGTVLQSRAQGQQNQALQNRTELMDQLARDQMAKQDFYASIMLPSLMQAMRVRDPKLMQMAYAKQRALPGYPSDPSAGGAPPVQQAAPVASTSGTGPMDPTDFDWMRFSRFQPPE